MLYHIGSGLRYIQYTGPGYFSKPVATPLWLTGHTAAADSEGTRERGIRGSCQPGGGRGDGLARAASTAVAGAAAMTVAGSSAMAMAEAAAMAGAGAAAMARPLVKGRRTASESKPLSELYSTLYVN